MLRIIAHESLFAEEPTVGSGMHMGWKRDQEQHACLSCLSFDRLHGAHASEQVAIASSLMAVH